MRKKTRDFQRTSKKIEHEISSELEAKVAKFGRRVWEVHDKYIERVIAFNKRVHEEHVRRGSETPHSYYTPWEEREKSERERQRSYCLDAIQDYRDGLAWYSESKDNSVLQWGHEDDIVKIPEPLIRIQPEDFTIGLGVYIHSIKNDLMERGFRGIVESLEGLVRLCILLAKPENHVQVKSKQRGQKPVVRRTVGDMVNEMEGELTELPKYTAYAKVLQGQQVWKGKIQTKSVGEEKYNPLCVKDGDFRNTFTSYKDLNYRNLTIFTRRDLCEKRTDIEEEIRKRQENWRPKVQEPEKPIEEPKKPEQPKKAKTKKDEPPPPWY